MPDAYLDWLDEREKEIARQKEQAEELYLAEIDRLENKRLLLLDARDLYEAFLGLEKLRAGLDTGSRKIEASQTSCAQGSPKAPASLGPVVQSNLPQPDPSSTELPAFLDRRGAR